MNFSVGVSGIYNSARRKKTQNQFTRYCVNELNYFILIE